MKTEKQIIYDDENAARFVENIKGWVDINNRFYGDGPDSEHMARWASCTHKACECGKLTVKGWTKCNECRDKDELKKYNKLPFRAFYGELVYSHVAEKYFASSDDIDDYCNDNEIDSKSLMLVFCEPVYFNEIGSEYWEDVFPEDSEGELPKKMHLALEALNGVIKELPPISYSPGKVRTEYRSE